MGLRDDSPPFKRKRAERRAAMGGAEKVRRVHERGRLTVRERIDHLLDAESFHELGTFARSQRPEDHDTTPGDGKIVGFGRVAGREVGVAGDDVTVKRGSSAPIGSRKVARAMERSLDVGCPFVYFGETGGARIPDTLGSEGFSSVPPSLAASERARAVPVVSVIAGESFGGSSFQAAFSDIVIQVRGSCLAVTSPRVIHVATGEDIGFEELGGVDVHARTTGMIDRVADDDDDAIAQVKACLGYLPQNAWSLPERASWDGSLADDDRIYDVVPTRRTRAYDMRKVIALLSDDGQMFELKPDFARSMTTALVRVAGRSVGIVANNPNYYAGAITPDGCDKATSFVCLCDAFNIPLVFLQDVPGFMVGRKVEHERLLHKAIMFEYALGLCRVPRITVILRKAFGLAYFSMGGGRMGARRVLAWPGAEISFMDPEVGVNVLHAERLKTAADPTAERARLVEEFRRDTDPFGAAGIMDIDEVIDPAETRRWLRREIDAFDLQPDARDPRRPLAYWPTCF